MFTNLEALSGDPILALMAAYREDPSPDKVDLGVGIYQDEDGNTPILRAVTQAEERLLATQTTKAYVGIAGSAAFNERTTALLLGADHPALRDGRVTTVQSTGGSGGLRVAGELLASLRPGATVWVTTPTWPNHRPLLTAAGLRIEELAYYNARTGSLDAAQMLADIEAIPDGDVLLLHGCCHNPTGADLTAELWSEVTELCVRKGLLPFVDTAYQGFAVGLDEDMAGVRHMARHVPELVAVSSCSKNFGLYRERTGSLSVLAPSRSDAQAALSHLKKITRAMISMPPDHGAAIVAEILGDSTLRATWLDELTEMRERMRLQRQTFAAAMQARGHPELAFISGQNGMFSLLGVDASVIETLREAWHVYIVGSGRINVAGLTKSKLNYVADALAATLKA